MDGPPEMVEGMVIIVMTSCSLRPARRARKPPMDWIPSWELPAMRMTASEMRDDWEPLPVSSPVAADWLIEKMDYFDQNAP
jgi:hypothetical protein